MKNYVPYHMHTELSLLDSCTNHKLYSDKAAELGQTAIAFTEHGNNFCWVEKKMYANSKGLKYIHGVEIYLTETLDEKIRDNYHTVLLARNYDGVKEINTLIDLSTQDDHRYYKPRITFTEFFNISDNVIKISACLASPLNKFKGDSKVLERLLQSYDYYEIQYHNVDEQIKYNQYLYEQSLKLGKPLIVGTDTHSLNKYKAECRSVLQLAKGIEFSNEDEFDLTYKTYDELVEMFRIQNSLPEQVYLEAIENTNAMADSVEDFELDLSFKYPKFYENENETFVRLLNERYAEKVRAGVIKKDVRYKQNIQEEYKVFKKLNMVSFMLFMSELMSWCWENGIPTSPCRGSVGGSTIAYILDITDVDPVRWGTMFSRFANEDRLEIGDIDIDIAPSQRETVFNHIIERAGQDYTAHILSIGTVQGKGTIDEIGRALSRRYYKEEVKNHNLSDTKSIERLIDECCKNSKKFCSKYGGKEDYSEVLPHILEIVENNPWSLSKIEQIKREYEDNAEAAKENYPELFYYFDGVLGCAVSQSVHPAGIIVSPISLYDNYGTFWHEGKRISVINMEEIHEVSLVKYDILGLKSLEVIKDTCEYAGIEYPKSHKVNWEDEDAWADIITSPVGIFQFEGPYAFRSLKQYRPRCIDDMSVVNAALRPSGETYRDKLLRKEWHKNPSKEIDELLAPTLGYLVFQEQTIQFLQDICGLSGSEADTIRRAIGRKQRDRLDAAMPSILEGYCKISSSPREQAEQEAKEFLQIIEDSADYQFGFNHSTGYSMVGYLCGLLRKYYPLEFITAYLNNANNQDDITNGAKLAEQKGIKIKPIKFRHSSAGYTIDREDNAIYKGLSSIKFMGDDIAERLYEMRNMEINSFIDFLDNNPCNSRQTDILIKLDYFSEFGKGETLLRIVELYSSLNKVQFNKSNLPCDEELFKKYGEETPKQYRNVDAKSLMKELLPTIPDEEISILNRIKYQEEYIGYIDICDPKLKNQAYVIELNTKYSPKLKVYMMDTGETEQLKLQAKKYQKNPFKVGAILYIHSTQRRNKYQKINGDWCEILDEWETWISNYEVIN